MDSSVLLKVQIWFQFVCHYISNVLYLRVILWNVRYSSSVNIPQLHGPMNASFRRCLPYRLLWSVGRVNLHLICVHSFVEEGAVWLVVLCVARKNCGRLLAIGFVSGSSLFSASGTVLFWGQFTAREEIGTLRHN